MVALIPDSSCVNQRVGRAVPGEPPNPQFTPVLRRATQHGRNYARSRAVSIHARLATGDLALEWLDRGRRVSIHARLATGDGVGDLRVVVGFWFQFTPVLRRATAAV